MRPPKKTSTSHGDDWGNDDPSGSLFFEDELEDLDTPLGCETCPNRRYETTRNVDRDISRPALMFSVFLCALVLIFSWEPERNWFSNEPTPEVWAIIALAGVAAGVSIPTHTSEIIQRRK